MSKKSNLDKENKFSKEPLHKKREKYDVYDVPFACRGFHHANSKRKELSRYDSDREEALEYTDNYPQLRNGKGRSKAGQDTPDVWDDYFIYRKWPVKPRKNDHKGKRSIRKIDQTEDEEDEDT